MPGPWDSAGKRLLREMPQHVVTWLLKGATFVRTLPTELKSRNIFADGLYEITVNGQPALAYTFGGLAPGSEAYESWFRRSFAMLDDILEDSWTYQEIVKKGREKERHVRIREQRENVLNLVHMRFPDLITMTELRVETINDPDVLHTLLNKLFTVQTPEEAKQAIIDASTAETAE